MTVAREAARANTKEAQLARMIDAAKAARHHPRNRHQAEAHSYSVWTISAPGGCCRKMAPGAGECGYGWWASIRYAPA
jgi:hypothetical protein